jgi:hypothetical protein
MPELTDEQKARRVAHFRRVIKYRSWFGWIFAVVGASLFYVGFANGQNPMVLLNGFLFLGYGLFMVRQAKRAMQKLR